MENDIKNDNFLKVELTKNDKNRKTRLWLYK